MTHRYFLGITFLTILSLTGCAKLVKTGSVSSVKGTTPGSSSAAAKGQHGKISTAWLSEFSSPAMSRLVNEAISNNPNLNAAAARLRASQLGTIGARANLLPSLNASTSTSRSRNGNGDSTRSIGESYGLSLNASWEPDIWGRLRDLSDASISSYHTSVEDYRNARLSLAANTAKGYCNLVTAGQQLELAERTLESFKKNKNIVERNYKAGILGTRAIAVQLSRTNVASAQRSIENRTLQRDNAARTLESLLGRYPAAEQKASNKSPNLKDSIPTSLPATLVSRRPDLVAAQLDVLRSAKLADASRKSLLPSLNLSSRASTGDSSTRNLFDPHFLAANIAGSLSQRIYNGGELKANAAAALARNKATIYDYSTAAIRAFREVEDAIARDASLKEQEIFLVKETKQATFAERSAILDYSEGIDNSGILEILESQRRANNARASLIILRNSRLQNRIDLHLALGGDFRTEPSK
jgi:NodT family efflux transporter outer membrane factor (OMF) lipoprotein